MPQNFSTVALAHGLRTSVKAKKKP
ncbi:hypothetical protein CCACVL1_23569 [Corchorus capsularis]|uniref:Uncharacterized protein n=1 Tax=Corchorus capsularis TaxID=210143 RepID=A0A1R3GTH5_COCAP|nr:hypothetical protein CCACVL1_23569 [Corchorus capsularis]